MTLGRSTSGAIKIKTDGGLRAVSCGCCATTFGLLASATSAGGQQDCAMGPAVQNFYIDPPYRLSRGKTYTLRIEFNSGDSLYHVGSFYQANFVTTPATTLNWQTSAAGTSGDPWSISNAGNTIRFSLEDSENCGGSNGNTQSGTARAVIQPTTAIVLDFSFAGIAELEASGFENIDFYLEEGQ
jgi:hypothetical protein